MNDPGHDPLWVTTQAVEYRIGKLIKTPEDIYHSAKYC